MMNVSKGLPEQWTTLLGKIDADSIQGKFSLKSLLLFHDTCFKDHKLRVSGIVSICLGYKIGLGRSAMISAVPLAFTRHKALY